MTSLERGNNRRPLFLARTIFVLRVFLGLMFLHYGMEKLLGGQFFYGDWAFDKKTVDGGYLVFAFYGYSPVYAHFLGFCEALPAALLFFRKTATLGAAMLFAVSLNITVMDFCYDGMLHRVKFLSLIFTIMLGFLLWCDFERLRAAFWTSGISRKGHGEARIFAAADLAHAPTSVPGRLLLAFGVSIAAVAGCMQLVAELTPSPQAVAVQSLLRQGWENENVRFQRMHAVGRTVIYRRMTVILDFEVSGTNSAKIVHVQESRRALLFPWRVDKVTFNGGEYPR